MNAVLFAQPGQSEFVPVTEIPASEQLPSAPLVIAAYAFVWIAFLAYVWLDVAAPGQGRAGARRPVSADRRQTVTRTRP